MKVVINACFGGFSLSDKAFIEYEKRKGTKLPTNGRSLHRDDPILIEVVETLGKDSWGACAELTVVEIPDDVEWEIAEYDGKEHVAEKHRIWY